MMVTTATRVRRPLVAGYYYPRDAEALRVQLEAFTSGGRRDAESPARGAIVPHGSYAFSGAIAGAAYQQLRIPARCIVLAPNHAGAGARWSVMAHGAYASPLGELPVDEALAERLRSTCPWLEEDERAQRAEHAIEVQVPFLQWCGPMALSFVPIVINSEQPEEWARCADALAEVLEEEDDVFLLASSDLSHYERREVATEQDRLVLGAIERLDVEELTQQVRARAIAMCGLAPVACALSALARLGATRAEVVRYGTSADAGGDPHSVTGYAGVVIR